jgi:predicted Zn-dependent protease
VKLNPEERQLQLLLGDALALSGEARKAAEPMLLGAGVDANDALAKKRFAQAEIKKAEELARRQDASGAEREFRRALAVEPDNVPATIGVARMLLDQGHPKAAAHWARKANALDPRSAAGFVVLGDALAKAGDQAGAGAAWKKAVEVEPNDAVARSRALIAQ